MSESPSPPPDVMTSPTFAPRRVFSDSPTCSPTRSPGICGSDDETSNISSPTFAPRKLAGVGGSIFRMDHASSSNSTFEAVINSHRVDATGLMKARTQMRNVSAAELKNVVTHGKCMPAKEGPQQEARFKYEHHDLVCITDKEGKNAIACWKNITTFPKAASQQEVKLVYGCRPEKRDLNTVKTIVSEHGVNPNITCSQGLTPVMRACQNLYGPVDSSDAELLKYLLSIPGVDIDYPSEEGNRSALHWSVVFGSPTAVELLLAAGASPFVQDANGQTPVETVAGVVLSDGPPGTIDVDVRKAVMSKLLSDAVSKAVL
jgi:hypothetical protein